MPVLQTERLVLRPFDQQDLKEIAAWKEIAVTSTAGAQAQDFLDYCFREYRERGIGPWAMQQKETGSIVGNCGFPDINFKERLGEVNYYVAPQYRRQGLATEALLGLFLFGFEEIGLARIQARCDPDNLGSERVMQKAGMKFERFVEYSGSSNDTGTKQKLYSILRNDYKKRTPRAHIRFQVSVKTEKASSAGTENRGDRA